MQAKSIALRCLDPDSSMRLYITIYNAARNKIRTIERAELLEKMVKSYIGLGLEDE